METNKDKIKLRINALLSKTTENGASEAEAVAALKKANELMKAYYIDENDLSDPYLGEKCISVIAKIPKTSYDITLFYGTLSKLFDCFHYYNRDRIVFFGFEDDAKLAGFFFEMISKTVLKEAEWYKKSAQFREQRVECHGRTLVASFIKGFLYRISLKLNEMYENRKSSIPDGMGLMLINKRDKVEREYNSQNVKVHSSRSNLKVLERDAFLKGCQQGEGFSVTQGVEQHRNDSTELSQFKIKSQIIKFLIMVENLKSGVARAAAQVIVKSQDPQPNSTNVCVKMNTMYILLDIVERLNIELGKEFNSKNVLKHQLKKSVNAIKLNCRLMNEFVADSIGDTEKQISFGELTDYMDEVVRAAVLLGEDSDRTKAVALLNNLVFERACKLKKDECRNE